MTDPLHLIVLLGGERVALPIADVGSVIEVAAVTPVPRAAPHVAGLAAMRSRVVTLIDCRIALGITPAVPRPLVREAVVVSVDGHDYGLIVDAVEDVVSAHAAPAALAATLGPVWLRVGAGMVVAGDALLPRIEPAALIDGGVASRTEAAV